MQMIFPFLAAYLSFILPMAGLGSFAVGYVILRWRDREDPELGPKALFAYLRVIAMQMVLACVAMILTSFLTDLVGNDSKGWRALLGVVVVNVPAWLLFGRLLARTNVEDKPAARRLFDGFGFAMVCLIALVAASVLASSLLSEGFNDVTKSAFAFTAVYLGAAYYLLRQFEIKL